MDKQSSIIFAVALLIFSVTSLRGQHQEENLSDGTHGTCAVLLATPKNVVMAIDSYLTPISSADPCSIKHTNKCKLVLAKPNVLIAVTGVFNETVAMGAWDSRARVRQIFSELPENPSILDLLAKGKAWFTEISNFYNGTNPTARLKTMKMGEPLSEILVATRINGTPETLRVSVYWANNEVGFAYQMSSKLQIRKFGATSQFSGSCRDNIVKAGEVKEAEIPKEFSKQELSELRHEQNLASSIANLMTLATEYETVLSRVSSEQNKCYVGGPVELAQFPEDSSGWISTSTECGDEHWINSPEKKTNSSKPISRASRP
jgi:hypothetical protein